MDDIVVERVLRIVELVPAGRVVSYGTVGIVADCSPRYVGRVMKEFGSNVTWWRVVNAAGRLPAELLGRAREKWADEGTDHTPDKALTSAFLTPEGLDALWSAHGTDPDERLD